MEAKVIVTTELELKALVIDAVKLAFKYHQPEVVTTSSNTDEVLTIDQAAEFLSLTKQTIYGLVSDGKIPYSKPTGSRLYFSRLGLIEWLKDSRRATTSEQVAQYEQKRTSRRIQPVTVSTKTPIRS